MNVQRIKSLAALAMFVCICVPAFAHHGEARYDTSKPITMKGTVTDFQFTNPHTEVYFDVKDTRGNVERWVGEATSPNMLARVGWSKHTLKRGDQITASGFRGREANTLLIDKVILPTGQVLDGHVRFDK